jgi:type IV pilus assembly protein PilC
MKLVYKAATKEGKIIQGFIEAKTPGEVAAYLRNRDYHPIKIVPQDEANFLHFLTFRKKVNRKEVVFFTRQLASMLNSGLTLMQALSILKKQVQNQQMKEIVGGIITNIEEGNSFSNSITKYPTTFTPIYIALVKAAEESGLLDKVLERLADNLEKQMKLKATIRGALTYPAIVVIMMVLVMILMMVFVIPNLTKFYKGLNVALPLSTQIIVGIGNTFIFTWPFVLCGLLGAVYSFRKWYATESGKMRVDGIVLKMPVFGRLMSETLMAEFTRTFGLLIGTGSLVVESLEKSAGVVGNLPVQRAIESVAKRVEKGVAIGDAMSFSPLFPSIVVETVKIGEQTGKLDESLLRVSDYFEREVDQRVKTLTSALEPFIMILLAGGVGFLIVSIITPIYSLISSIQ